MSTETSLCSSWLCIFTSVYLFIIGHPECEPHIWFTYHCITSQCDSRRMSDIRRPSWETNKQTNKKLVEWMSELNSIPYSLCPCAVHLTSLQLSRFICTMRTPVTYLWRRDCKMSDSSRTEQALLELQLSWWRLLWARQFLQKSIFTLWTDRQSFFF